MKRNTLALAVGALFVAPAAQAQITFGNEEIGTLQIYGKLYPQFGWASSTGATQPGSAVATFQGAGIGSAASPLTGALAPSATRIEEPPARQMVNASNSYIGFRGERGLGSRWGGLKAIWQLEQTVGLDSGDGTWASRDSFVGLSSGSFGTVRLGNMDTVYKQYGDTLSLLGVGSGNFVSASNVLSNSISSVRAARFHERRNNSIMYETPTFSGFTAGIMYGPDEAKTNSRNANFWSYGVKWDTERYYASLHQEKHEDAFGLSQSIQNTSLRNNGNTQSHSMDTATRASGEIRLRNMRITLDLARLEYDESNPLVNATAPVKVAKYEHTNWAIGWDGGFGPWRFATQYIRAGEGSCSLTSGNCSTAGLGATMWTMGARYRFDRQTYVYAIAALLTNGQSANYQNNSTITGLLLGSDTTNVAIGLSYSF